MQQQIGAVVPLAFGALSLLSGSLLGPKFRKKASPEESGTQTLVETSQALGAE